jgi:hypothetical protein
LSGKRSNPDGTKPNAKQVAEKIPQPARARAQAAEALNVNERYVSDAARIKEQDAQLHRKIKEGSITLQAAKRTLAERRPANDENRDSRPTHHSDRQFVVVLWDQTRLNLPLPFPNGFASRGNQKGFSNLAFLHLSSQPYFHVDNGTWKGLDDVEIFVVPRKPWRFGEDPDAVYPALQNPSCLFLTVSLRGEVPKPTFLPGQIIKDGFDGVLRTIVGMWPDARRLIVSGRQDVPEGWEPVSSDERTPKTC